MSKEHSEKTYFSRNLLGKIFSFRRINVSKDKSHYHFSIRNENEIPHFFSFETGLFEPSFRYMSGNETGPEHTITSGGLGFLFMKLPWKSNNPEYKNGKDIEDHKGDYGYHIFSSREKCVPDSIMILNGKCCKIKRFPWELQKYADYVLLKDMAWVPARSDIDSEQEFEFVTPFNYVTKLGYEQHTLAHVRLVRSIYVPKMFMNSKHKLFKKTYYHMDIDFDNPVGEGIDSYEGGTYGISYQLKDNEKSYLEKVDIQIGLPKLLNSYFARLQDGHKI